MFYCRRCAQAAEWPETMFQSDGRCEVCGNTAVCSERQSSQLPPPHPDAKKRRAAATN